MIRPKVNKSGDINLGTNLEPRMVKIGPDLPMVQKEGVIELLSVFKDVLFWIFFYLIRKDWLHSYPVCMKICQVLIQTLMYTGSLKTGL